MVKRVLVTGGNKGIGFALVQEILRYGPETAVIVGSRSRDRGEAALRSLYVMDSTWERRVELVELDVSDSASVAAAADDIRTRYAGDTTPLYGVVNNAGVGFPTSHLMDTLQVNVYGIERVCTHFNPLIWQAGGRIVNVTSAAGPSYVATCSPEIQGRLTDTSVTWEGIQEFMRECLAVDGGEEAFARLGLGSGSSYGISKACANALTLHWAREKPGLMINACTPGFIETDLTRPFAKARGVSPAAMGMKSPREGTVAPLFLLFGAPHGTGHYYGSDACRSPLDRYRSPGDPEYTDE